MTTWVWNLSALYTHGLFDMLNTFKNWNCLLYAFSINFNFPWIKFLYTSSLFYFSTSYFNFKAYKFYFLNITNVYKHNPYLNSIYRRFETSHNPIVLHVFILFFLNVIYTYILDKVNSCRLQPTGLKMSFSYHGSRVRCKFVITSTTVVLLLLLLFCCVLFNRILWKYVRKITIWWPSFFNRVSINLSET